MTIEKNFSTIESTVASIWKELLHVECVDEQSDFFELGGNSLTAIKFISKVEEKYGRDSLLPSVLFEKPILKELCLEIEKTVAVK